ncbi:MAG: DUF6382 domain-containing protein [Agathobacter sp.]|nr:DUF6382 domain-containing protein [Agathobacter sp.]
MINREVIYERNMTGSFMKIPAPLNAPFDEKMMLKRKIPGLLSVEKCYLDGGGQYWYNISGRQSLETFCRVKEVRIDFIEKLIISICSQLEILEWNLIDINCLLLDPEMIFITNSNQEVIFTVYPGEKDNIHKEFQSLMEYLLKKIDHKDLDAVHAAYAIYEKTMQDDYNIIDIRDTIIEAKDAKAKEDAIISERRESRREEREKEEQRWRKERYDTLPDIKEKESPIDRFGQWRENLLQNAKKKWETWFPAAESYYGNTNEMYEKSIKSHEKQKRRREKKARNNIEKRESRIEERIRSRVSGNGKENRSFEENIIYPTEKKEVPVREQLHPTICLSDYRAHPEGLLLYEGTDGLENIRLEPTTSKVGKGIGVEIQIEKETVSHFHAKIEFENHEYYIEDMNSTNGTFVNEEPLSYKERKQLKNNDIVRFADVKYRFV